jgi:hypothetical protein
MKKNIHKFLGTSNEFMAEMIFRFLADSRKNFEDNKVNYVTWLDKMDCLIPKNPLNFKAGLD